MKGTKQKLSFVILAIKGQRYEKLRCFIEPFRPALFCLVRIFL